MLSARTRGLALATLLVVGGVVAATAPAHAAPGATIEVESDVAFIDEPLIVGGSCPSGSETAVVTLVQDGEETAFDAVGVAPDLSFEASLDLTDAVAGPGTATVDCIVYGSAKPLASASTDLFVIDFDLEFEEIEVGLSSRTVALGGTITVSATCPEDATDAVVLAGNEEAEDPFFTRELTPGAGGKVSVRVPITKSDSVAPEAGTAIGMVVCGSETEVPPLADSGIRALSDVMLMPSAFGIEEFTITPATARSAVPSQASTGTGTTAARAELANTGSDGAPLTAIALALIAAGGAAIRLSRRA
jgi:hypothetical protein